MQTHAKKHKTISYTIFHNIWPCIFFFFSFFDSRLVFATHNFPSKIKIAKISEICRRLQERRRHWLIKKNNKKLMKESEVWGKQQHTLTHTHKNNPSQKRKKLGKPRCLSTRQKSAPVFFLLSHRGDSMPEGV